MDFGSFGILWERCGSRRRPPTENVLLGSKQNNKMFFFCEFCEILRLNNKIGPFCESVSHSVIRETTGPFYLIGKQSCMAFSLYAAWCATHLLLLLPCTDCQTDMEGLAGLVKLGIIPKPFFLVHCQLYWFQNDPFFIPCVIKNEKWIWTTNNNPLPLKHKTYFPFYWWSTSGFPPDHVCHIVFLSFVAFCFIQFNVVESHFRLLWRYADVKRGLRVSLVHACVMWKPSAAPATYWLLTDYYYYYHLLSWITECVIQFFHVRWNSSILVDATNASTHVLDAGRFWIIEETKSEALLS